MLAVLDDVSQIGYMFLAAGLGPAGYAIGIMHLLAHGFFKAGLFLGAGSVMHAMNDEVDMRRFGGLRESCRSPAVTFGFGYLAIIGFPPFSGFFTKDKIIEAAFDKGGTSGWILGLRRPARRRDHRVLHDPADADDLLRRAALGADARTLHPHESPTSMTVPMIVLAVGSVFAGGLLVLGGSLQNWLEPVVGEHERGAHTRLRRSC